MSWNAIIDIWVNIKARISADSRTLVLILQLFQNIHLNFGLAHDYRTHQVRIHTILNIDGLSGNRLQVWRHIARTLQRAHHISCRIIAFRHWGDGTFSIHFTLELSFVHRNSNRVLSQLGSQSATHYDQHYRHHHKDSSGQTAHFLTEDHSDDHEHSRDKVENEVEYHAHLEPIRFIFRVEPLALLNSFVNHVHANDQQTVRDH